MSKINLLPWREELRKVQNKNLFLALAVTVLVSVAVVILCGFLLNYKTDVQRANIEYINKELESVKSEIFEIQHLQENKKQLLERLDIIRSLQVDRPSIVRLFDILPRTLPDSVYVTSLSRAEMEQGLSDAQAGAKDQAKTTDPLTKQYHVQVEGVAITNSSISIFLKKLQEVKWISEVKLNEVSINKDKLGLDFKLEFIQHVVGRE